MSSTPRLAILAVFLVTCAMAVRLGVAQHTVSLSPDDERCFYVSTPASVGTPLRSCQTCLNSDLATPRCFLDARGLCRAMSGYDPSDDMPQFVAVNTTYCSASDATCTQCLASASKNGVCKGEDDSCICLAACASPTWADDVTAIASASEAISPTVVVATRTVSTEYSSPVVIIASIAACFVVVLVIVNVVHRRWTKKLAAQPVPAYNVVLTPTATLPSKSLAGQRV